MDSLYPHPHELFMGNLQGLAPVGWLWLLPFLPLLGGLLAACAKRLAPGRLRAPLIAALLGVGASAVLAIVALVVLATTPQATRYLLDRRFTLIAVGAFRADFALVADPLSAVVAVVIAGTAALVLAHELSAARQRARDVWVWLPMLVATLLLAVLADSMPLMLMGWGASSVLMFLLVGAARCPSSPHEAQRTFLVRMTGDAALLTAMALLFWCFGGGWRDEGYVSSRPVQAMVLAESGGGAGFVLNARGRVAPETSVREVKIGATVIPREMGDQIAARQETGDHPFAAPVLARTVWGIPVLLLVMVLLLAAAASRAAQLPFFGATSALATAPSAAAAIILTAGMGSVAVYLLLRFFFLIALWPAAGDVIAWVGVLSALGGAACAAVQLDTRRVLAFATVGQLGLALAGAGLGSPAVALLQVAGVSVCMSALWLVTSRVVALRRPVPGDTAAQDAASPAGADALDGACSGDRYDLRNLVEGGVGRAGGRGLHLAATLMAAGVPISATFYAVSAVVHAAVGRSTAPGTVMAALAAMGMLLAAFALLRAHFLMFQRGDAAKGGGSQSASGTAATGAYTGQLAPWSLLAVGAAVGMALGLPHLWGEAPLERWLSPLVAPVAGLNTWLAPALGGAWTAAIVLALGLGGAWLLARRLYGNLVATGTSLEVFGRALRGPRRWLHDGLGLESLYRELVAIPVLDFARAVGWFESRVVSREPSGGEEPSGSRFQTRTVHYYLVAFTIGILLMLLLGLVAGLREIPS